MRQKPRSKKMLMSDKERQQCDDDDWCGKPRKKCSALLLALWALISKLQYDYCWRELAILLLLPPPLSMKLDASQLNCRCSFGEAQVFYALQALFCWHLSSSRYFVAADSQQQPDFREEQVFFFAKEEPRCGCRNCNLLMRTWVGCRCFAVEEEEEGERLAWPWIHCYLDDVKAEQLASCDDHSSFLIRAWAVAGIPSAALTSRNVAAGVAALVITLVFCRNQIIGFLMTSKHLLSLPFFSSSFSSLFPSRRRLRFVVANLHPWIMPGDRSRPRSSDGIWLICKIIQLYYFAGVDNDGPSMLAH